MAKRTANAMETVLRSLKLFKVLLFFRCQRRLWADEELHAEEHWNQYFRGTSEGNESERVLTGLLQDLESHAWRQSQH